MLTKILGIGTALPHLSISQADSCAHALEVNFGNENKAQVLQSLYRRTTIERRSLVMAKPYGAVQSIDADFYPPSESPTTAARMERYNIEIAPLSRRSCEEALAAAQVDAREITHLVTASCTGFAAPGFDLQLIKKLSLSPSTYRTHIGFMGCHGALNALRTAHAFCTDEKAVVLVCAAEICSMHFQYSQSAQAAVSNALFADGAAAVVLKSCQPDAQDCANKSEPSYAHSKSFVIADSEDAMTWQIGDNGFLMTLSPTVPALIEEHLPDFIHQWLADNQLKIDSIKSWAVHPGGPRILDAVQSCLNLPPEILTISRQVLAQCGNMSSPTVLFILQRILAQAEGDMLPCVMLAFGPGLTIEAALII